MRFVLNRDIVFMAELMTALTAKRSEWPAAIKSRNCFRLPTTAANEDRLFRYAAAICVLAAELQVNDNRQDGNGFFWKCVAWLFRRSFHRSRAVLEELGFRTDEILHLADKQSAIESLHQRSSDRESLVRNHAFPTRAMFSLVFEYAARIQGCVDLADAAASVGADVGDLLYLVDAAEDWSEDRRKLRFNSLRIAFQNHERNNLPPHVRDFARALATKNLQCVSRVLGGLQTAGLDTAHFGDRLAESVSSRLDVADTPFRASERFQLARQTAREFVRRQADRLEIRLRPAPTSFERIAVTAVACAVFVRDLIVNWLALSPNLKPVVHEANSCYDCCNTLCFCLICAACAAGGSNAKRVVVIHKKAGPCD
jgi:hypothetical protein